MKPLAKISVLVNGQRVQPVGQKQPAALAEVRRADRMAVPVYAALLTMGRVGENLPISRQRIAKRLKAEGMTVKLDTISRALTTLHRQGWVMRSSERHIRVDRIVELLKLRLLKNLQQVPVDRWSCLRFAEQEAEGRSMSQAELADLAGVSLRTAKLYKGRMSCTAHRKRPEPKRIGISPEGHVLETAGNIPIEREGGQHSGMEPARFDEVKPTEDDWHRWLSKPTKTPRLFRPTILNVDMFDRKCADGTISDSMIVTLKSVVRTATDRLGLLERAEEADSKTYRQAENILQEHRDCYLQWRTEAKEYLKLISLWNEAIVTLRTGNLAVPITKKLERHKKHLRAVCRKSRRWKHAIYRWGPGWIELLLVVDETKNLSWDAISSIREAAGLLERLYIATKRITKPGYTYIPGAPQTTLLRMAAIILGYRPICDEWLWGFICDGDIERYCTWYANAHSPYRFLSLKHFAECVPEGAAALKWKWRYQDSSGQAYAFLA